MFYLAKGLGTSPQSIEEMEFVEFMEWVDLEIDFNQRQERAYKEASRVR